MAGLALACTLPISTAQAVLSPASMGEPVKYGTGWRLYDTGPAWNGRQHASSSGAACHLLPIVTKH